MDPGMDVSLEMAKVGGNLLLGVGIRFAE
jgi:hypothetical protein